MACKVGERARAVCPTVLIEPPTIMQTTVARLERQRRREKEGRIKEGKTSETAREIEVEEESARVCGGLAVVAAAATLCVRARLALAVVGSAVEVGEDSNRSSAASCVGSQNDSLPARVMFKYTSMAPTNACMRETDPPDECAPRVHLSVLPEAECKQRSRRRGRRSRAAIRQLGVGIARDGTPLQQGRCQEDQRVVAWVVRHPKCQAPFRLVV